MRGLRARPSSRYNALQNMSKRPDLPELEATGRRYRDDTLRVRLQSPGIERYGPRSGSLSRGGRLLVAALVAAGLVAAMLFFMR
jgi:hypothetical protein